MAGLKFSDTTTTFSIPAGTPIVTIQRGAGGTTTPVALTEIKKDQLLNIWEKDSTVNFIVVMGGNGPRTGNANGNGSSGQANNGQ